MSKPKKVKKRKKKKNPYAVATVPTTPARPTTLWDGDGMHIRANFDENRNLVISGQDLKPSPFGDEYEYAITVQREDIEKVVDALGGVRGEGAILLLKAHGAELKRKGVHAWLMSIGIAPKIWNWY